jgi:uncharacterized protein (TIGR04255 family)
MITNSKETMNIDLDEVKLPKKVDPCPILQAIVELRFDSTLPNDAIFGIIYKEFQDDYPNVEELPILQLPEIVRKQDPNLLYKPNYRLSKNEEFVFQVGAKMVSLAINKPYTGWQLFSEKLHNHIERVDSLNLSNSYSRIGIRYINGLIYLIGGHHTYLFDKQFNPSCLSLILLFPSLLQTSLKCLK